jgi:hypothetical protein
MDLRDRLRDELEQRSTRNARYSLRAFARDLGVHHTSLTRLLDRRRRITPRFARLVAQRLRLTKAQIDAACITNNAEWLARFIPHSRFTADSRALAVLTGMNIDDVNIALHELLYRRQLTMTSQSTWATNP